jgi:hypothetical protein
VAQRVTVQILPDGTIDAITEDGEQIGAGWRSPGTLITVGEAGLIEYHAPGSEQFYEAGCKLYCNDRRRMQVLKGTPRTVKATQEVRERWSRPWQKLSVYSGAWNLPPQAPEAYLVDSHLVLLGDSTTSELVAALQAGEVLLQAVDAQYPGPGKSLLFFAWSPFALEKNVVYIGASDEHGIAAGVSTLKELLQ